MKRRGLQLSRRQGFFLYAASVALFVSGVAWAWIHHWDELGKATDGWIRLKQPLIAIHGLSAMVFVLVLGTVLVSHVRRAWHAQKNRKNGSFFLTAVSLLVLSGYVLYYLSDENWRNTASAFHLWLGIISPALLLVHILFGRRQTK